MLEILLDDHQKLNMTFMLEILLDDHQEVNMTYMLEILRDDHQEVNMTYRLKSEAVSVKIFIYEKLSTRTNC